MDRNKDPLHEPIYFDGYKDGCYVEIAMQYNKDVYVENIHSFANNISTAEGGTHLTGFKTAITKVLNDYAKKFNFLKENDKNLLGEDVREGLTAVISVKYPTPNLKDRRRPNLVTVR